jgi:hypothetical protein
MSSLFALAASHSVPPLEGTAASAPGTEEAGGGAVGSERTALVEPAPTLKNPLPEPRRLFLNMGLLLAGFWMIYFHIGLAMEARGTLRNNMFFHSDIGRVIADMTRANASHARTNVHPLFVLLTQPVGAALTRLFHSPTQAALLFNSFIGGMTVALTCLLFRMGRVSLRRSLLGALLLGFSSSHLYFSSAPETFIFSCLGLILLFMGLTSSPRSWRYYLPVGVFSFGVLITNFAFVVITYAASVSWASWRRGARRVALLGVGVVGITVLLALTQKAIWPRSALFFLPELFAGESRFESDHSTLHKVKLREAGLLRYIFVYDFFAPKTYVNRATPFRPAVQMRARSLASLPSWGKVAAGLWLALLLAALWRTVTSQHWRQPLMLGLVLCVLYNFFLHTLYGDDLFLYSCNTCFCLIAWMIFGVSDWNTPRVATIIDLILLALLSAELVNNVRFVKAIALTRYGGA